MANFGEHPTSENRERVAKNEESAEETKKQLDEAMAAGDFGKVSELAGQMQGLKGQKEQFMGKDQEEAGSENAERKDYDEASEMNKQFDEAKAAQEAEERKVKLAEEARLQAEDDAKKAAELLAKIKGTGEEKAEQENISEVKSTVEKKQEATEQSIENEPLGPVMQEYEKNIEDIISQSKQMRTQAEELRKAGKKQEAANLDIKANEKSYEIFNGGGETINESFIKIPNKHQKSGETYAEFRERVSAPAKEYRKALNDSPQMILKIANETGRLDWQNLSGRLLRNKEFIEAISKTEMAKRDSYFQVALRDNLFGNYADKSDNRQY